MPLFVNNFIN